MAVTTAVKPPRAPRNVEQATDLLEQIARLDGEAAGINANRDAAIAATNATADALLLPVLEQRAAIAGVIEAWWQGGGKALLPGKRKTMELGGCTIGSAKERTALTVTDDDFDAALARLREHLWAKPYVRTTFAVDRKATGQALADPKHRHAVKLRALGFGTRGGADVFVLEPIKQGGTAAG